MRLSMICLNKILRRTGFIRYSLLMQRLYKQLFYIASFFVLGGFFAVGNISLAWSQCTSTPPPSGSTHTYTCEFSDQIPAKCGGLGQTDIGASDCNSPALCYICNEATTPKTTTNTKTATPCKDPRATRDSVTGICSCPTWETDVADKCTPCNAPGVCCGVKLNTSIPFIGSCIESNVDYLWGDETAVSGEQAFPTLIGSLTKIMVSVILIVSFILIVVAGVMIASGQVSEGKKMIINVAVGLALLGASWVILHLINPNFFG